MASCEDKAHPAKFNVQVVNEEGNPISNATVGTGTFARWEPGQAFGRDIWEGPEKQKTDHQGLASFEYSSKRGEFGINVHPVPQGYYRSTWPKYKFQKVENGRWIPENPTIKYVLKKKRNPIPLYVKSLNEGLPVPLFDRKCGYDFEAGDWVTPHGIGKTTDIFFLVKIKKEANGDFDSSIEVTFPNEGDGLIYFENNQREGSELTSDYLAPEKGYKKHKLLRRFQKDGKITSEINRTTGNYYLRLRTRLDGKGNIKSSNFAKLYGDFMYFTYYFNPTRNDRNVEFDPEKNLIKGERISRP